MKKICLSLVALLALFSCQKEDNAQTTAKASRRICASQEVLERQLQENPELAAKMSQIEAFTENAVLNQSENRLVNGKIQIITL